MVAPCAVVVVTHQSRQRALDTLGSLLEDPQRASWEVVVVDNASADGTAEAVTVLDPAARVLRNERGRGYAGALNQGVTATAKPFVALMTAGTLVPTGAIGRLVSAFDDDPRVAAVGPLIRHPDGRVQRHGLFRPSAYTAFVVLSGLARLGPFRGEAERYYGAHAPGPARDVDQLTGACVVVRRAAFDDVGPFDAERFYLYCEDVDWSLRARERGWRLRFVPAVEVVRPKSVTSATASGATIRLYYRSLRAFYAKHSADPLLLRPLLYGAAYLKEGVALLANALRREKGLRY